MDAKFYFNQGIEKSRQKDFLGAIQDYTTAIKLTSGVTKRTITENHPNGTLVHTNVFDISEGFGEIYFNRGLAYLDIGKYIEAVEDFAKVIEYAPNDAEAYFKRAVANYCLENDSEMKDDLTKAFNLDSKYTKELFLSIFQG